LQTGRPFWTPFLALLLVQSLLARWLRRPTEQLFQNLDRACKDLDSISAIMRRVELEAFSSARLNQLHANLMRAGTRASEAIARLGTLCDFESSRHNMVVRLIDLPLLYSVQVACALQRWRVKHAGAIPGWLDAIGEIEALLSLAAYAFEHPEHAFPELVSSGPAFFSARGLGHPLLPQASCVRNDVELGGNNQVLLVSGSNMSGKSTLLRAVGINAVLAFMGAPICAKSLRLSPACIGAAMRASDSLQKGVSHFYAEIQRIRQVVELSSQGRLIFLLDEILQGTNSQDRRVGAEGVLRTLIKQGAIGLVTTHDLALTSIAELFPDRVRNVYFQEKLEAGKLSFDYKLRPGIVSTHNGVELMRSVGLDV
jgi:DNA mismatch repair ATPase MutS